MLPITISKKYLHNIFWLLTDYSLRLVGGYFITIWMARYIGPETYGVFSYATASAAILAAIGVAGLNGVAIKFLVEENENHNKNMGTIFTIRLTVSVICYLVFIVFLLLSQDNYSLKTVLSFIICFRVVFTPFSVIESYFDSIVLSKNRVLARNIAYGLRSLLIVLFIVLKWPLFVLGIIPVLEEILGISGLVFLYQKYKHGKLFNWKFDKKLANRLMKEAWPMVISSAGAILYVKIDQVMVVELLDELQGGYYAVAVKISELFAFIPGLIVGTFYPTIIQSKKISEKEYKKKMQKLILLMMSIAFLLGILIYFLANEIVYYSFGNEFIEAVPLIRIHIWTLILTFLATVLSRWLIIEKLTKFSLLRHLLGVIANIGLNFLLIPIMGSKGAAIASIISLFCAVILFAIFDKKTISFLKLLFSSFFIFPFSK